MASTWWKIIVLQILITIVTRSAAYEPDEFTKLSNENIVWLFKNFLEVKLYNIFIFKLQYYSFFHYDNLLYIEFKKSTCYRRC